MTPQTPTLDDVNGYMARNRDRYLLVLQRLKRILEEYRTTAEGRQAIHSIYSRGQRQRGGDELKQAWQIREKVTAERETDPAYAIQDLHDMIGLTVVCVYPDSIDKVLRFIAELNASESIDIVWKSTHASKPSGYQATHIVVGLTDEDLRGIRCEVQVKTLLMDAWSAWTHDLTYKPAGLIPRGSREFLESVSKRLITCQEDGQTVRDLIEHLSGWTETLRDAYRVRLVRRIIDQGRIENLLNGAPKRDLDRAEALIRYVSKGSVSGARLDSYLDWIEARILSAYPKPACLLGTALALSARARPDLSVRVSDYLQRYVETSESPESRIKALSYQSNALFYFGFLPEAIQAAESELALCITQYQSIEIAAKADMGKRVAQARMNLAHYLAELGPHHRHLTSLGPRARRAYDLVEAAKNDTGDCLTPSEQDTEGWVRIRFGLDQEEISEGRRICESSYEAYAESPDWEPNVDEWHKAFALYHVRVAEHRLKEEFKL